MLHHLVLLLLLTAGVAQSVTVRLVGGTDPRAGRLEVHHNGVWGTVCNDHFTSAAAQVVCHMLGYGRTGRISATSTVRGVDRSGWTTCSATDRRRASPTVRTRAGAETTAVIMKTSPSRVSLTRLKQSLWSEEEIHGLDVLKCSTALSGEPFVMTDSLTQQQGLFAILWDSDTSDERWTSTYTVWATG